MIKTDLIHKYKDREPLETVKIISNFYILLDKQIIC